MLHGPYDSLRSGRLVGDCLLNALQRRGLELRRRLVISQGQRLRGLVLKCIWSGDNFRITRSIRYMVHDRHSTGRPGRLQRHCRLPGGLLNRRLLRNWADLLGSLRRALLSRSSPSSGTQDGWKFRHSFRSLTFLLIQLRLGRDAGLIRALLWRRDPLGRQSVSCRLQK
jgi:hypothetical protein